MNNYDLVSFGSLEDGQQFKVTDKSLLEATKTTKYGDLGNLKEYMINNGMVIGCGFEGTRQEFSEKYLNSSLVVVYKPLTNIDYITDAIKKFFLGFVFGIIGLSAIVIIVFFIGHIFHSNQDKKSEWQEYVIDGLEPFAKFSFVIGFIIGFKILLNIL